MTNALAKQIGIRIKALREQRGLTQRQLAHMLGKSIETISNFERGSVATSLPTLERLAQIFEVPVRDFFEEGLVPEPDAVPTSKHAAAIQNSVKTLSDADQEIVAGLIAALETRSVREERLRKPKGVRGGKAVTTTDDTIENTTPVTKPKRVYRGGKMRGLKERHRKLNPD